MIERSAREHSTGDIRPIIHTTYIHAGTAPAALERIVEEWNNPARPAGLTTPDVWGRWVTSRMRDVDREMNLLQQFNQQLLAEIESLHQAFVRRPLKWPTEIYDLGPARLRLMRPLMVVVEEYPESGIVGVAFPPTESYAEGMTLTEAMALLKDDIASLYSELSQDVPETLGRLPWQWLRLLREVIVEEPANGALE